MTEALEETAAPALQRRGRERKPAMPPRALSFSHTGGGLSSGRVVYSENGRQVGRVVGATLEKRVRGSLHQLRHPPAWCCDEAALRRAEALGASAVAVHDEESGDCWRAALELFWRKGFAVRRGHGAQRGLALKWWTNDAAGATSGAQPPAAPPAPALFEVTP